jgi:hypothetical protein
MVKVRKGSFSTVNSAKPITVSGADLRAFYPDGFEVVTPEGKTVRFFHSELRPGKLFERDGVTILTI